MKTRRACQEGERQKLQHSGLRHSPGELSNSHSPEVPMQMLYPFSGTILQYNDQHVYSHCRRPCSCALCGGQKPLPVHGFYSRTVSEPGFPCWIENLNRL